MESDSWHGVMLEEFARLGVRHLPYVPDGALAPLVAQAQKRDEFAVVPLTREEEGVGYMAGVVLGGQRGALLMQTSGVGNSLNAIGSLTMAQRLPLLMVVTERGGLGEIVSTQNPFGRALTGVLDAIGIHCFPVARVEDVPQVVEGAVKLAEVSRVPVVILLTSLLLGGAKQ